MKYIETDKSKTYIEQIKIIINTYKHSYYRLFSTHPELKYLYDYILNQTKFMNDISNVNLTMRLKYVIEKYSI